MGPPPSHQTKHFSQHFWWQRPRPFCRCWSRCGPKKIDGFGWSKVCPNHSHSFPQTFHDIAQVLKTNPLILERIFYMTGTKTMVSSKFSFGQDLEAVKTRAKLHDPLKNWATFFRGYPLVIKHGWEPPLHKWRSQWGKKSSINGGFSTIDISET